MTRGVFARQCRDCVYDATGNPIETHEHKGDFKEWTTCKISWPYSRNNSATPVTLGNRPFIQLCDQAKNIRDLCYVV